MSTQVVQKMYAAMKAMDLTALAASFADDVVAVEPSALPYGGTTTSRDALFGTVFGYLMQRVAFQLDSSEVFGDGLKIAGHFTATMTAIGSGEVLALNQVEIYQVRDGLITHVEVFQNETPALIEFFERNGPIA
jgi:ketosteroid isomerase-like protein